MRAPLTSETSIGNFEVEKWYFEFKLRNSKLKVQKNFQIFLETYTLEFGLFFKFGVITWFTKQIAKFVKRKFQGRSEKFYEVPDWSFDASILSFILKFEVRGIAWTVLTVTVMRAHLPLQIYRVSVSPCQADFSPNAYLSFSHPQAQ